MFSLLSAQQTLAGDALDRKVTVDIPAQALSKALLQLGRETNLQIMLSDTSTEGKRSAEVKGTLPVRAALDSLLRASGLSYKVKDNTVTISPAAIRGGAADQPFRLAAGTAADESDAGAAPAASADGPPDTSDGQQSSNVVLTEVTVTGSHIRGDAPPAGSKLIVIDADQINQSGYGRLEDFLTTVTQNFESTNESVNRNVANDNHGAEIDLRGLGPGTTLTLVNGQRQPSGGRQGAFVDISNIPTAAIKRIEILPDGASAIYGSDAIGGVVNIILRDDLDGAETSLHYGQGDGGADETRLAQLFGTKWASGNVLVGYQYYDRGELMCSARAYCAANGNLTPFGGTNQAAFYSNPGTILNSAGQPAYAIPAGQDGTHLTVSQLIPGANHSDYADTTTILPEQRMNSVFFNARQQLGDALELFSNGQFSDRDFLAKTLNTVRTLSVPATNPFYVNPFGGKGPVRVAYDFSDDFGPEMLSGTTRTYVGNLGVTAKLPADWRLTLTGSYGRESNTSNAYDFPNISNLTQWLADSNPATALNVFGAGSHTNPATLDALRASSVNGAIATSWSTNLTADGPVLDLPGGSVNLAVGSEFRRESVAETSEFEGTTNAPEDAARHVTAAFAELAIPLFGASNAVPAIQRLDLSLAARYDNYSDVGHTTNPKVGLSWRPSQWFDVRGTWGKSFRAPPFYLSNPTFGPPQYGVLSVQDPTSATHKSNALVIFGNSPGLKPERANVWSLGLDFSPPDRPTLKASAGYFNIHYTQKIQTGRTYTNFLAQESIYAPLITRNPTAAQLEPYCTSKYLLLGDCGVPIAAILDDSPFNLSSVKESGLDFSVQDSVSTDLGSFGLHISGTRIFHYDEALTATTPLVDLANIVGNPLALRVRGGPTWERGLFSAAVTVNYSGSSSYTNPATHIASLTTFDLNFGVRWSQSSGWLSDTRVGLSAVNVFNRAPPFVNQFAAAASGYDYDNFNLLGRLISLQVSKGW